METNDSIKSFFEKDHREIDSLLAAVDFKTPNVAVPLFAKFNRRLERHIRWEEELLFPKVGEVAPALEYGPISVMRDEHRQIRACKAGATAALNAGDGKSAKTLTDQLCEVLGQHNMKEEHILYAACDQALPSDTRREILERLASSAG